MGATHRWWLVRSPLHCKHIEFPEEKKTLYKFNELLLSLLIAVIFKQSITHVYLKRMPSLSNKMFWCLIQEKLLLIPSGNHLFFLFFKASPNPLPVRASGQDAHWAPP